MKPLEKEELRLSRKRYYCLWDTCLKFWKKLTLRPLSGRIFRDSSRLLGTINMHVRRLSYHLDMFVIYECRACKFSVLESYIWFLFSSRYSTEISSLNLKEATNHWVGYMFSEFIFCVNVNISIFYFLLLHLFLKN